MHQDLSNLEADGAVPSWSSENSGPKASASQRHGILEITVLSRKPGF